MDDPDLGPLYLIKADISDSFYCIAKNINDIPKLVVVLPTEKGQQLLVALPLVLSTGWKNSPPIFSTASKRISDLANQRFIDSLYSMRLHYLNDKAKNMLLSSADAPSNSLPTSDAALETPPDRDPSLPPDPMQGYIDVFVDDVICLVQGNETKCHVLHILLYVIDQVFCSLDISDNKYRQE